MSGRILLVDDEPAVLFAYKKVLQRHQLIVDAVDTKEKTLRLLDQNDYEVAFLDLCLSGEGNEDGFELLSHIKAKQPNTVAIIITACGNQEIRERAYRLGADHYFEKPVSINTIRDALESAGTLIPSAVN